jgi:hypothetical protein
MNGLLILWLDSFLFIHLAYFDWIEKCKVLMAITKELHSIGKESSLIPSGSINNFHSNIWCVIIDASAYLSRFINPNFCKRESLIKVLRNLI